MQSASEGSGSGLAAHWTLDPAVTFLNHGSFGACPRAVLEAQSELRAQLEAEPVRFFVRECMPLLDAAREELARFLGADPERLAFVPNATSGVNAVLASRRFESGDELLVTDHAYNACRNALEHWGGRDGAVVRVARVPFPLEDPEQVVRAVLDEVGPRTALVMLDHVTSATGLVLPLERLVEELHGRGIDVLVDGAHAPGMVPLDLEQLGVAYYTGNCHKWICAPKGAAFLHVRRDKLDEVRPAIISHGANSPTEQRSRFRNEFDWIGTLDPTPWLCIPVALRVMADLVPGGWGEVRSRNREQVLAARDLLASTLGIGHPAPDSMLGSLATLPLPDGPPGPMQPLYTDPLQDRLLEEFGIEVPIGPWPAPPRRNLRVSAQLYNSPKDYERLAEALTQLT